MKIEEVQSTTKKQRVASHTHIKGLGLKVRSLSLSLSLSRFHFLLDGKDWGMVCGVQNSLKVRRSAVKRVWMEEGYLKDFSEPENAKSSFCCLLAPLSPRRKWGTLDQRFEHVLLLINYSSKYHELEVFRVLSLSLCFLGLVLLVLVLVFFIISFVLLSSWLPWSSLSLLCFLRELAGCCVFPLLPFLLQKLSMVFNV
jgi:hypothetical protein